MRMVKLSDVVNKIKGDEDRLVTDRIYYVGGEHYESDNLEIKDYGLIKGATLGFKFHFPFEPGDVLFMSRNPHLHKAGRVDRQGICSDTSYILRTKNEDVLSQDYLPLIMQSDYFWMFFEENKTGSVNQLLNWSSLKDFEFYLPDIDVQRKHAALIWKIQDEINEFTFQLEQLDLLVKSRFIEMFGGCKETVPISKVCSLHSRIGWQALTKAEHMASGEYMLITGTDFKDGTIDYTGCKYVSKDRYEMDPNIIIQNGDVLITKDGTIGKVAVVKDLPKPATLNAGVFVVRNTDNQFLTEFIQQCLLSSDFQRFIESVKRGATIVHLNQEKFLKYELPVVDLDLQRKFVEFVQQVDKSKVTIQKHLENTKALQKSLINKIMEGDEDAQ